MASVQNTGSCALRPYLSAQASTLRSKNRCHMLNSAGCSCQSWLSLAVASDAGRCSRGGSVGCAPCGAVHTPETSSKICLHRSSWSTSGLSACSSLCPPPFSTRLHTFPCGFTPVGRVGSAVTVLLARMDSSVGALGAFCRLVGIRACLACVDCARVLDVKYSSSSSAVWVLSPAWRAFRGSACRPWRAVGTSAI